MEQLNAECDHIAKHARNTMKNHSNLMPSLRLPNERIGLYKDGIKLYKNFRPYMIEKCSESRVQTYYCRKYNWTKPQFESINWDAISGAMIRCNPSTAKWVTKFCCGFIGTTKTLARREYWLGSNCPLCQTHDEDNVHIICCPHPPHRERAELSLLELYKWMEYINFPPDLFLEIKRINKLWLLNPDLPNTISNIPTIQL